MAVDRRDGLTTPADLRRGADQFALAAATARDPVSREELLRLVQRYREFADRLDAG